MKISHRNIFQSLNQLWPLISKKRRFELFILLIQMLSASVFEMVSIGAILPFLAVLLSPEQAMQYEIVKSISNFFGIRSSEKLFTPLAIILILAVLVSALSRGYLVWRQINLCTSLSNDFCVDAYEKILHQPYLFHISKNSSEFISVINNKVTGIVGNFIGPMLVLISSLLTMIFILSALLMVNKVIALTALSGFGLIYFVIVLLSKRQLAKCSRDKSIEEINILKALQEGLGGIRDILIDGSQKVYVKYFENSFLKYQASIAKVQIISQIPRYAVEAFGMIFIICLVGFYASSDVNPVEIMPIMGLLAMSAQKLLPLLQQSYGAYTTIRGANDGLQEALNFLKLPNSQYNTPQQDSKILFEKSIRLVNISFKYDADGIEIFKELNFEIEKGDQIGLIGKTGSGKSTLLDLLMGLLIPTEGYIFIDGKRLYASDYRRWQSQIAHVPQFIFLADSTVAENIAFGVSIDEIDFIKVQEAAERAEISEVIEKLPLKYMSRIGERGVKFSGGQRQRIGIARALYKNASVIVLDEATSALDQDTEKSVIKSVEAISKNVTTIMVSHRHSSLRWCNKIFELSEKGIKKIGTEFVYDN